MYIFTYKPAVWARIIGYSLQYMYVIFTDLYWNIRFPVLSFNLLWTVPALVAQVVRAVSWAAWSLTRATLFTSPEGTGDLNKGTVEYSRVLGWGCMAVLARKVGDLNRATVRYSWVLCLGCTAALAGKVGDLNRGTVGYSWVLCLGCTAALARKVGDRNRGTIGYSSVLGLGCTAVIL